MSLPFVGARYIMAVYFQAAGHGSKAVPLARQVPNLIELFSRHRLGRAFLILLVPGISLKRWLGLAAIGAGAVTLGILFALQVPMWPGIDTFAGIVSLRGESYAVRAAVFIGGGLAVTLVSVLFLLRSLASGGASLHDWWPTDTLYVGRLLSGGPRVVVVGGGSGLPNLLRGLKNMTSNITAVVTAADDGGSSGRLRDELGILPPGDIRNCLVALADSEDVMQRLMDYRFSSSGHLNGHSVGNILIAALAEIGGDFNRGVEIAGELLAIRGQVIPSTTANVTLVANTTSGRRILGESQVGAAKDPLGSLALLPANAAAHPGAIKAIEEADLIIIGPGSLYTSIVPNLLVSGVSRAIARSHALKLYVCNVAGEPGQTMELSVMDHAEVIRHYIGKSTVGFVLANNNYLNGAHPDTVQLLKIPQPWADSSVCLGADIIDSANPTRHDAAKLGTAVAEFYQKYRGRRRRLPPLWRSSHRE